MEDERSVSMDVKRTRPILVFYRTVSSPPFWQSFRRRTKSDRIILFAKKDERKNAGGEGRTWLKVYPSINTDHSTDWREIIEIFLFGRGIDESLSIQYSYQSDVRLNRYDRRTERKREKERERRTVLEFCCAYINGCRCDDRQSNVYSLSSASTDSTVLNCIDRRWFRHCHSPASCSFSAFPMPGCSHPSSKRIFRATTQPPVYRSLIVSLKTWWRCIWTSRNYSIWRRPLLVKIHKPKKGGTNWTMSHPIVRRRPRIHRHPGKELDERNCAILKRSLVWKTWSSMENDTSTEKPMWRTTTVCCSPKAKGINRSSSKRAIALLQSPKMNDWCRRTSSSSIFFYKPWINTSETFTCIHRNLFLLYHPLDSWKVSRAIPHEKSIISSSDRYLIWLVAMTLIVSFLHKSCPIIDRSSQKENRNEKNFSVAARFPRAQLIKWHENKCQNLFDKIHINESDLRVNLQIHRWFPLVRSRRRTKHDTRHLITRHQQRCMHVRTKSTKALRFFHLIYQSSIDDQWNFSAIC